MNAVSLIGRISEVLSLGDGGRSETRFQVAVPRRERDGRRAPGVLYVDCLVRNSDLDIEDAASLATGAIVGLAGRLEVDSEHIEDGWRETHTVLVDQLDVVADSRPRS
ncbi:MAG TPA: hypothetical protein VJT75_11775 [Thermoleophilaceae bacterium]|nr:hypothetical protein [Thermoleophilaceae bacterium]